jgi:alanine racemase
LRHVDEIESAFVSPETMRPTRPIRAEISRSRLLHNFRILRQLAGPETELVTVIKANAYGHGLEACAQALAGEGSGRGSSWFGVTCVEEAVALRRVCPQARILAMSGCWEGEGDAIVEQRITPAVWTAEHLDLLAEAAARRGLGPGALPVHLEIDTGMSRQGAGAEELPALLSSQRAGSPGTPGPERFGPDSPLRLEAVMTHFHSADQRDVTEEQVGRFAAAVERIAKAGLKPEYLSAGSSGDLLDQGTREVTRLAQRLGARRMVRTGIALYGYPPYGKDAHGLEPVLVWKTRVTALRTIPAGATVGYGATFRAERLTRLALLPAGYADGLNRLLSNRGAALVRGQRAPIAGRVSMDQTTIDVTDIPGAAVGDEAVLLGAQGNQRITADDVAQATGTISYEVLCAIGARVPRVMVD